MGALTGILTGIVNIVPAIIGVTKAVVTGSGRAIVSHTATLLDAVGNAANIGQHILGG